MPIDLKICGMNSEKIIQTIVKNGDCNYLGFVFYPPSPRNLTIEQSKKLTSMVPDHIKKVAVLVKPEDAFVERIKDQFEFLQIYETSPARAKELKLIFNKKIIQAIKIKKKEDIDLYKDYIGILAGGININNIEKALKISKKIDISSSLEDNPGEKSVKKVSDFLLKVKNLL